MKMKKFLDWVNYFVNTPGAIRQNVFEPLDI